LFFDQLSFGLLSLVYWPFCQLSFDLLLFVLQSIGKLSLNLMSLGLLSPHPKLHMFPFKKLKDGFLIISIFKTSILSRVEQFFARMPKVKNEIFLQNENKHLFFIKFNH